MVCLPYQFTYKCFLLVSCPVTCRSNATVMFHLRSPLKHAGSCQPYSFWFTKIQRIYLYVHSLLTAPETAVWAGWGWLMLWISSRTFHCPSHSFVFSTLWIRACFRQYWCNTGGSTFNGQVGKTSCSSESMTIFSYREIQLCNALGRKKAHFHRNLDVIL